MEILSEIAEADMSDFMTVGADGVTFFDFGPDTARRKALKGAKTRTKRDEAGNTVLETQFQEVELESKISAIERLAKLAGWDKPEKRDIGDDTQEFLKKLLGDIDGATRGLPPRPDGTPRDGTET
jgi:hypothetical protein